MARQALSATISIGAAVDASVGRALGGIQKSLRAVGKEIRDLEKAQVDLDRQRNVLRKKGEDVSALDAEYQRLGETLDRLREKQSKYDRVVKAGRRVGDNLKSSLRSIGRVATATAAAIGSVSAAGIALAKSAADAGDEIGSTAAMLGISTDALQELRYAAETSDVTTAQLGTAMEQLNKRLGEAAEGGGPAAKALDEIGLSAKQLAAMSPDEALMAIADGFEGVQAPGDRARLVMDLFGKSGQPMLNLLAAGSDGMRDMRAEAHALGMVMSEETVKAAGEFDNAWRDMNMVIVGIKTTIGGALIPVFTEAVDAAKRWMLENGDAIQAAGESFTALARAAIPAVGQIVKGIGTMVVTVSRALTSVKDFLGGWEQLGYVIGGVVAAFPLFQIAKLGVSIVQLGAALGGLVRAGPIVVGAISAIGKAIMANPIGAAVALIAGAAWLIIDNWDKIKPHIQPILDWFGARAADVAALWEKGKERLGLAWAAVGDFFERQRPRIEAVTSWFSGAAEHLSAGWEVFKDGMARILEALVGAFDWAKEKIGAVVDWFARQAERVSSIGSSITGAVSDGASYVGEKASAAGSYIGAKASSAKDAIKGWFADEPQARAVGGTFRSGPLLVGERGPELLYPSTGGFVAHNRQMRNMVALAAQGRLAAPQAPSAPVNITINQAPGEDPRTLVDELMRRMGRRGRDLFDGVLA